MEPIANIRKTIFGLTQSAFGAIAGVDQATVCRWEKGGSSPDHDAMRRIRDEAAAREIAWDDRWFFEIPVTAGVAA